MTATLSPILRSLLFGSLLAVSCVAPDISAEGHACPCPEGYACDPITDTCAAEPSGATSTGTGSSTTSGPSECSGVCGTAGCGACPDVAMIDAGGFFIDAYEATRGDYATFLADTVDVASQSQVCAWNDSFDPLVDEGASCPPVFDYSLTTFPMSCVDWCDAAAFCAWAGKRMCGRIDGGTVAIDDLNDSTKSEWYSACSLNGANEFPYGSTLDDNFCNTVGNASGVIAVGSFPDCEGGLPGLFDMVGNAEEWEDACDLSADPALDNCALRGGAFWATAEEPEPFAKCSSNGARRPDRNAASHDWGFRCCKDP